MSTTPVRNGKFASFMSVQGGGRHRYSDRHDRRLQFQKFSRAVTLAGAILGATWVAIESAKALSFF